MIKNINIDTSRLNNSVRVIKARECAAKLLIILRSKQFKSEIVNMDRDKWLRGETSKSSFKQLTNEEIYNKIMSGKEEWNDDEDFEVDLIIDDYYSWGKVVGYMMPNKPTIFVNTKFFDSMSKLKVVSNMAHEYLHTLGSRHSGYNLRDSLPYFMNHIVSKHYYQIFKTETPEPKYKTACIRKWYRLWIKKCVKVRV